MEERLLNNSSARITRVRNHSCNVMLDCLQCPRNENISVFEKYSCRILLKYIVEKDNSKNLSFYSRLFGDMENMELMISEELLEWHPGLFPENDFLAYLVLCRPYFFFTE